MHDQREMNLLNLTPIALILNMLGQRFVRLTVPQKRVDIVTRMVILHDKLVEARLELSTRKVKSAKIEMGVTPRTVNVNLNPTGKPRCETIATATDEKLEQSLPTNASHLYQNSILSEIPVTSRCRSGRFETERRIMVSEPIPEDKQNEYRSPLKGNHTSPTKEYVRHPKPDRNSPMDILTKKNVKNVIEDNLLQSSDREMSLESPFGSQRLVTQGSDGRDSYCTNRGYREKRYPLGSGQRQSIPSSHPRFRLSNKYFELNGCQWQSAYAQEDGVEEFEPSSIQSQAKFKEISFVPSIFQKKSIRRRKKKTNKVFIEISSDIRDRVANLIKMRLKLNQDQSQANKKERSNRQNPHAFLQATDLQKKLKETLVKKVQAMHDTKKK